MAAAGYIGFYSNDVLPAARLSRKGGVREAPAGILAHSRGATASSSKIHSTRVPAVIRNSRRGRRLPLCACMADCPLLGWDGWHLSWHQCSDQAVLNLLEEPLVRNLWHSWHSMPGMAPPG